MEYNLNRKLRRNAVRRHVGNKNMKHVWRYMVKNNIDTSENALKMMVQEENERKKAKKEVVKVAKKGSFGRKIKKILKK